MSNFFLRKPVALLVLFFGCILHQGLNAQKFYYGADLSYVNEMEDCGVRYHENAVQKDPYQLFASTGHNLVRVRLWHTPSWYDTLNTGKRYCDLADVTKTIRRAKAAGMEVLLDFHLSDFWADPSRQLAPNAWLPVVGNTTLLGDSVYNYVFSTLQYLQSEVGLPEMVQIGNETNKGICLSPAMNNMGFFLDWPRNAALFKRAIQAVRAVQSQHNTPIQVALHVAGPADTDWLMAGFWQNGVRDFDVIGMSYYWAWHKPTTIAQCGDVIASMRQKYPGKKVMVFETGHIWTMASNDQASNIISETYPATSPATPANQKEWLMRLTREVIARGGNGVIYWEPAWQSSPCFTPWGRGSHQEHATFFDFQNNALPAGGLYWPQTITSTDDIPQEAINADTKKGATLLGSARQVIVGIRHKNRLNSDAEISVQLNSMEGKTLLFRNFGRLAPDQNTIQVDVNSDIPAGHYILSVLVNQQLNDTIRLQIW